MWVYLKWPVTILRYYTNVNLRKVARRCSVKKVLLEILQNSQENTCARVSFLVKLQAEACNFIKKETLVQMCSSKFCKISKYTFSYRTLPVAASVISVVRLIKTEGSAIHWFSKEDYENLENAQENIRG